jgi:uncharacterized membrane protein (GlpM family)
MLDILLQTVLPFALSALVVIIVTIIAEKYGTKTGGIIGTLPITLSVAYIFIALNKGVNFASNAIAVVPAVIGINLIFLGVFAVFAYRSTKLALVGCFTIWVILSTILYLWDMQNIYISLITFTVSMVSTFFVLEKKFKIKSIGKKTVHYTPFKILLRGLLTGTIIMIAVLLSNIGEVLSGIFTVFPAISISTMLITEREHGPNFSAGIAKSMIFGSWSIINYAVVVHFLFPKYGIIWGTLVAFCVSLLISYIIFNLRGKIS